MDKFANDSKKGAGLLIYGGTFNPVHIGHLRLAIEAMAKLGKLVERAEFVPNATPPHKSARGILPFELRARLLEASLPKGLNMSCNRLEAKRPGPSYTFDTLLEYASKYPGTQLFFLLGSQDYELLPTWKRGLDLPLYCNLAVAPRGGFTEKKFIDQTIRLWPNSLPAESLPDSSAPVMQLHNGAKIYYLQIPQLEISASRIRAILNSGGNADYLTTPQALKILAEEKKTVAAFWQENNSPCSTFPQKS